MHEDTVARLRRDIRTIWFVLNNTQVNETDKTPRFHRKNSTWDSERASGIIEGATNNVECVC